MPQAEAQPLSRGLPQSFYDQALASIAALYPGHELLLGRRAGMLGQMEYALVVYRETPQADSVHIEASAVNRSSARAWSVEATCRATDQAQGLVSTLETLANLH
jgi:hypothetical protein